MKTIGNMRKLFLLLALIVAGVQGAWAWENLRAVVITPDPINGVTYELCHVWSTWAWVESTLFGDNHYENSHTGDSYYASVVAISGTGNVVISDTITSGGVKYPVKYIGWHTEQTETPAPGYPTFTQYGYVCTPVDVIGEGTISSLAINGSVDIKGVLSAGLCTSATFHNDIVISGELYLPRATELTFNGSVNIKSGANFVCKSTELKFNKLTHYGKINDSSLTDIYYLNNLPAYSGSASNYFDNLNLSNVTAHVANKTQTECETIHNSWVVYNSFADVVPCSSPVTTTFVSNQTFVRIGGNGTASFTTKHAGETTTYDIPADGVVTSTLYAFSSGDFMKIVVKTSGEEKVEIFRDGIDVTSVFTKSGNTYTFEADDWEANLLWFDYTTNVLDEAVWTIKYTDQRQFITFEDQFVKDICVNNWDTNHDDELTFEEAAAVTSLGEAFKYNTQITKFNELQYFTGLTSIKAAFYGCSALEEVVVTYGVTNMRESFGNCNALKNVVIPPTVNNIERAFNTTSGPTALEHVTLPSSLTKIGEYAFASSGLKSIEIPEGVTEIGTLAFSNCKNLKMVYIPKSVTTIAGFTEVSNNLAFNACSGLESIVVDAENPVYESPNGCNAIIQKEGKKLIAGSKYTVIPEDVVTLDGYSFRRVGLTSIVIPASVTTINSYCFYQCESLTSVECKSPTPPTIKGNVFTQINSDCVLKVPQGCIEAYSAWSQYFGGGIMEAEREVTWSVLQDTGITGSKVVIARNGEDEVKTMASAFTTVNFYNQGVQKVTLKVPVGHEEQVTIYKVRILTVTSQTGAALYLTTKLGISRTKANLIINNLPQNLPKNFDTEEEAQAFINGFASYGTAEIVPTTTTVGVSDNVSIKVVLNSEDVTSQMDTSDPLYATYEVPLADLTDAVWQIVYRSIEEQMKTLRVSNTDQMEIVYERHYTNGSTISEYFKNSETGEIAKYVERFFDDSDRENTSSIYLKVPFKDANYQYYPVRVLCNGEDVTYQYSEYDNNNYYLIYEANIGVDQTWDISRDVSHRQTIIRKGGTTWNVEVEFDFPVDGDERYFYPDQIGTPLYVDFPTYNSIYAPNAYIYIDVEEGSTFTVLRNGVDVTGKFVATNGAGSGFTRYMLSEADNGGSDTQAALGFQFRDPAVWEITIGDTASYDLNNDNKVDISDVTKLVNKVLNK